MRGSGSGAWCWAEEGEDPDTRALATCAKKSDQPCQLYSVDDYVVWQGKSATGEGTLVAAKQSMTTTGASGSSGTTGPSGSP